MSGRQYFPGVGETKKKEEELVLMLLLFFRPGRWGNTELLSAQAKHVARDPGADGHGTSDGANENSDASCVTTLALLRFLCPF